MVLPIAVGTMLRQRYLVQTVLGQGGFGRTYLALDQERFNEPCVIKEFVVPYQDGALVEKSKSLFQREASILYQIQHPQIPRFWAAFEDDQRLFLVQDFVDGQTYRRLLSDRKQQGQAFSEAEVLQFLKHMLPVLSYIHDRDIVHRDITPENIILRTQTTTELANNQPDAAGLPVLIDFGAVKEATSHWPLMSAATRVGKVGYAPPEQLQTGKVYPNSDLYALAATSLTLLTGKEPQSLLDSQTLTWKWEAYAQISDEFGMILRRMLSVYPGDRYLSANEVLSDLQPLLDQAPASTLLPVAPIPTDTPTVTPPALSPRMAEDTPVVAYTAPPKHRDSYLVADDADMDGAAMPTARPKITGNQVKLGLAATALVGLGIAVPVLWQAWTGTADSNGEVWVSGAKVSRSEASRIIESQGLNSSHSALKSLENGNTSSPSTQSTNPPQPLQFPPGKISTIVQGNLRDEVQPYVLKGAQGQIMTATLTGEGVTMNLLRSNQEAVDASAYRTQNWTGLLPADDQYQIQVTGSGAYALDVAVSPISRPTEEETLRVAFARGSNGTTVTGQLSPKQVRRYLLKAKRGQILALKVLEGNVNLSAIAPNGQRIGGSATNTKHWQGRLPMDGDYVLEVTAPKAGGYVLSMDVY